jgi:hypothetical protein
MSMLTATSRPGLACQAVPACRVVGGVRLGAPCRQALIDLCLARSQRALIDTARSHAGASARGYPARPRACPQRPLWQVRGPGWLFSSAAATAHGSCFAGARRPQVQPRKRSTNICNVASHPREVGAGLGVGLQLVHQLLAGTACGF